MQPFAPSAAVSGARLGLSLQAAESRVDKDTILEHLHQVLMYGRLLAGHLLGYEGRTIRRDASLATLQRVVSTGICFSVQRSVF
jgi:hypothetical protein